MTPYVFISYSSVDESHARELDQALSALGISTFLDKKQINLGDNFKAKISTGLSQCTELVLIASPSSLESQWVFFEVGQAVAFGRPIITLLTHPGLKLPSFLADFQYASSVERIAEHFKRRYIDSSRPGGLSVVSIVGKPDAPTVSLGPSAEMRQQLDRFPASSFHGHVAIDGAVELHTFPNQFSRYGGITYDQLTTTVSTLEWSDFAASRLSRKKLDILGNALRTWVGSRCAKPNRIRFLVEPPLQMVLDNNEFRMRIGNSDYFTMRTVAELSRATRNAQPSAGIRDVFNTWWSEPGKPFPPTTVPYHISAQGVLFVTDPSTNQRHLILTLPSRQRSPLVPGWNATFAEQMWAPEPETPNDPWWKPYVNGLTIEAPKDRTGDRDIWNTVLRGVYEELGIQKQDLTTSPRLVASCIEQDMHFVAFIFVLQATLSIAELYKRTLAAPDREIGIVAAFPVDGQSVTGEALDPARQLMSILSMERFDGGPYVLPTPTSSLEEPWHLSSRLRIFAAARHLVGTRLLDHISLNS